MRVVKGLISRGGGPTDHDPLLCIGPVRYQPAAGQAPLTALPACRSDRNRLIVWGDLQHWRTRFRSAQSAAGICVCRYETSAVISSAVRAPTTAAVTAGWRTVNWSAAAGSGMP